MANVFPAPVSPVISQPLQKSFLSQLKPPIEAVVWRNLEVFGDKQKLKGKPAKSGRKLSQPTIGSKSHPTAKENTQRDKSGQEQRYSQHI